MELNKQEMAIIVGGAISSSIINSISKAINTLYELGKQTGSFLRRLINGSYCPVR